MAKTYYKCTKCDATDSDRGDNPPSPVALTCWNCGAGRGKSVQDQFATRAGMFAVNAPQELVGA